MPGEANNGEKKAKAGDYAKIIEEVVKKNNRAIAKAKRENRSAADEAIDISDNSDENETQVIKEKHMTDSKPGPSGVKRRAVAQKRIMVSSADSSEEDTPPPCKKRKLAKAKSLDSLKMDFSNVSADKNDPEERNFRGIIGDDMWGSWEVRMTDALWGNARMFSIRSWQGSDKNEKPGKGVTLNEKFLKPLIEALSTCANHMK